MTAKEIFAQARAERLASNRRKVDGGTVTAAAITTPDAKPAAKIIEASTTPVVSASNAPTTFEQACAVAFATGLSKGEAITHAAMNYPELHQQWKSNGGSQLIDFSGAPALADFPALVARHVKAGMTKALSIEHCVKTYPQRYATWRTSGNTQTL